MKIISKIYNRFFRKPVEKDPTLAVSGLKNNKCVIFRRGESLIVEKIVDTEQEALSYCLRENYLIYDTWGYKLSAEPFKQTFEQWLTRCRDSVRLREYGLKIDTIPVYTYLLMK